MSSYSQNPFGQVDLLRFRINFIKYNRLSNTIGMISRVLGASMIKNIFESVLSCAVISSSWFIHQVQSCNGWQQFRVTFRIKLWYMSNVLGTILCMLLVWSMVHQRHRACMKPTSYVLNIKSGNMARYVCLLLSSLFWNKVSMQCVIYKIHTTSYFVIRTNWEACHHDVCTMFYLLHLK